MKKKAKNDLPPGNHCQMRGSQTKKGFKSWHPLSMQGSLAGAQKTFL
jgi:hypothetical protein